MRYQQEEKHRSRRHDMTDRLFEPGWSGRFGAVMLTAGIAVMLIAMTIGIA